MESDVKEVSFKDNWLSELYEDNQELFDFDFKNNFIDKKSREIIIYKVVQTIKSVLSKKDFGIFFKYFVQNWNQELISDFYNISQPAVHKRLKKSKRKIKKKMKKWKFLFGGDTNEFFNKKS